MPSAWDSRVRARGVAWAISGVAVPSGSDPCWVAPVLAEVVKSSPGYLHLPTPTHSLSLVLWVRVVHWGVLHIPPSLRPKASQPGAWLRGPARNSQETPGLGETAHRPLSRASAGQKEGSPLEARGHRSPRAQGTAVSQAQSTWGPGRHCPPPGRSRSFRHAGLLGAPACEPPTPPYPRGRDDRGIPETVS